METQTSLHYSQSRFSRQQTTENAGNRNNSGISLNSENPFAIREYWGAGWALRHGGSRVTPASFGFDPLCWHL
ncbi:hypothetical protein KCP76_21055 [Salmonella enterica subsp. enterica serovar Weltevreden]|nr:hypothetical protein KCP76_21055 [Salmonella enterica subsp. enterica serovar Weltevreden]